MDKSLVFSLHKQILTKEGWPNRARTAFEFEFEFVYLLTHYGYKYKYTYNTFLKSQVWYSFIFDSLGASQAVYRNLWYMKSPLWEKICLFFGCFVISAQVVKKSTFWLPNMNEYLTSREYRMYSVGYVILILACLVGLSLRYLLTNQTDRCPKVLQIYGKIDRKPSKFHINLVIECTLSV